MARTEGAGVLWCDGRRTVDLPPGARIEVRRGVRRSAWSGCTRHRSPTAWSPSSTCPSAAGGEPPSGAATAWATGERTVLEELRITSLGVIEESVLELGPGFTAITGETGAGKTMVVTALGLLLGGRADSGAVRTGAKAAARRGPLRGRPATPASRPCRGGRRRHRGRPAGAGPPGLGRGTVAGLRRRRLGPRRHPPALADAAGRGARTVRPAPAAAARRAARAARQLRRRAGAGAARRYAVATPAARHRGRARRGGRVRPRACPGGRPAALRPRRGRGRRPPAREDAALAAEEERLGFADTLRTAAEQARECLSADDGPGRAQHRLGAPAGCSTGCASTTRRRPGSPTGWPRSATCSPMWRPTCRRTPPTSTPTRPGWPPSPSAGPRWSALTRKYGETVEDVLAWAEHSAARLLDLDNTDGRIAELDRPPRRSSAASSAPSRPRCRTSGPRQRSSSASWSPPSSRRWRCRTPG